LLYFRSLVLYFSNTVDGACTAVAVVVCAVIMRRALYQSVYHADTAVSESNGTRDGDIMLTRRRIAISLRVHAWFLLVIGV